MRKFKVGDKVKWHDYDREIHYTLVSSGTVKEVLEDRLKIKLDPICGVGVVTIFKDEIF